MPVAEPARELDRVVAARQQGHVAQGMLVAKLAQVGAVFRTDAQHQEPGRGSLFLERIELGHLGHAGSAPGGPEIDEEIPATPLGEGAALTVAVFQRQIEKGIGRGRRLGAGGTLHGAGAQQGGCHAKEAAPQRRPWGERRGLAHGAPMPYWRGSKSSAKRGPGGNAAAH